MAEGKVVFIIEKADDIRVSYPQGGDGRTGMAIGITVEKIRVIDLAIDDEEISERFYEMRVGPEADWKTYNKVKAVCEQSRGRLRFNNNGIVPKKRGILKKVGLVLGVSALFATALLVYSSYAASSSPSDDVTNSVDGVKAARKSC